MYTKFDFGRELAEEVNKKYDVLHLSNLAHEKYLDNAACIDKETRAAIMKVVAILEGEEFEITREQLLQLAARLQEGA
jgi:hypothetical protein